MKISELMADPSVMAKWTPQQMMSVVGYLQTKGQDKAAQWVVNTYAAIIGDKQTKKQERAQEKASDPMRNLATLGGGALIGGLGYKGADAAAKGIGSLFGSSPAATANTVGQLSSSASLAGNIPSALDYGNAAYGASSLGGAAPSVPNVVGASVLPESEGALSSISSALSSPYVAGPLSALGAGMGLYGLASNLGDMESGEGALSGASAGGGILGLTNLAGLTAINPLVGLGMGALAGLGMSGIKSGRNAADEERQAWRDYMRKQTGMLAPATVQETLIHPNSLESLDKSRFLNYDDFSYDVGLGGRDELKDESGATITNPLAKDKRAAYAFDVLDYNEKLPGEMTSGELVGLTNVLAALMSGGNKSFAQENAGYFPASIIAASKKTGRDAMDYANQLFDKGGYDLQGGRQMRDKMYGQIVELANAGKITPEQRNAYLAEIDKQFGIMNPNQGMGGSAEFGSFAL